MLPVSDSWRARCVDPTGWELGAKVPASLFGAIVCLVRAKGRLRVVGFGGGGVGSMISTRVE